MGWKEAAEPALSRMPVVRQPKSHVPFRRKLGWTAGVLLLYFFLTNVGLWGLADQVDLFGEFRTVLAGEQGSLMQVGIAPIVTASIVLQLLSGANLLGLDTTDPRDQVLYQGLQKVLVLVVTLLTAIPMVYAGFLQAGSVAGFPVWMVELLLVLQIFVGGAMILYMDEVISKWGVGSGVGLFIVAGVSQRLIGGFLSLEEGFFADWFSILTGQTEVQLTTSEGIWTLLFTTGQIVPLLTTVLVFVIVVYSESVRVEIPLSHARVKGARGRFPVKLIYASVLPVILVRAVQANIQFLGQIIDRVFDGAQPGWIASYTAEGQIDGGLFYYLSPVYQPEDWMWWTGQLAADVQWWQALVRLGFDFTFMIVGGAIFAIFWVETTNMGPESTAKQIQRSGMQIPGFRQDTGVVEKVMERYIPQVTVLGGALVGFLAVLANMLGTIGDVSGEGLLLTVSITYKLYEEIAEEQMMEMHPMMRQMFGNE